MSSLQNFAALELSQNELNMVEGGTLCLITGIVGSILGGLGNCAPKPTNCTPAPAPKPTCPPPAPPKPCYK